jgi:flagellar biosynthesis chaperone FliJ
VSGNRFPAIAYGKTGADVIPGRDLYRVLFSSPGFPEGALNAFERLATSIQWTGDGGDEDYPPCFALWPVGEPSAGVLVARLADVGRDTLGRPHTIRIDAIHLRSSDVVQLASLLTDQAWPQEPWIGPPTELELRSVEAEASLVQALRTESERIRRLPRLLRATHPNYRSRDFDLEFEASPAAPPLPHPTRRPSEFRRTPEDSRAIPHPASSPPGLRRWLAMMLLAAALALLTLALALWASLGRLRAGMDEWKQQQQLVQQLQEELRAQQSAHQTMSTEVDRLRRKSEASDLELSALKNLFDEYNRVLQEQQVLSPEHLRARLSREAPVPPAPGARPSSEPETVEQLLQQLEQLVKRLRHVLDDQRRKPPEKSPDASPPRGRPSPVGPLIAPAKQKTSP